MHAFVCHLSRGGPEVISPVVSGKDPGRRFKWTGRIGSKTRVG